MPNGRTHARITKALALTGIPLLAGCALLEDYVSWPSALSASAGLMLGHLVTPDLDVDGVTYEERRAIRKAGCLLGWLWIAYWLPYAKLFHHRGASHWLGVGTLTRAVYLLGPVMLVIWLAFGAVPRIDWLALLGGWGLQDTTHILMDWVFKGG